MIIVNAILPAKEEKKDEIITKAKDLITASRTHDGNISYNLVEDVLDNSLTFIEKWESKEALEAHMKTEEFIAFGEAIKDDLTDELSITVYVAEAVSGN
ncbi:MAG: antibiotic biosynthesis monooxygenase [Methanosphaera stadtmanae]|nr:antibiotic biosynthesis monooxygenase [Methanosphaera stadtmanae]